MILPQSGCNMDGLLSSVPHYEKSISEFIAGHCSSDFQDIRYQG